MAAVPTTAAEQDVPVLPSRPSLPICSHFRAPGPILTFISRPGHQRCPRSGDPSGCRMWALAWLGIASLCLGTAWAVPAKERRKAEKPKAHLALYENLDLDNYDLTLDNYGEILDLSNYEELYDYGDLAPKVRGTQESTRGRSSLGCILRKGLGPRDGWGTAGEPASAPAYEPWWLFHHSCWWQEMLYPTPTSTLSPARASLRAAGREAPASLRANRDGVLKP